MGRFSAGDARLHEPRQPKPANAAFRESRPPRSRDFSLGLEHPQSAIRPSCPEKPTLGVIARPPCPQRSGGRSRLGGSRPARGDPRGALPASSPWNPTGRMPAQAPRGCYPGRAAARRTRDIPTEFRATSARRRQIRRGCRPSRAFANPALRAASRAYRPASRARRPCIGGRSGKPRQKPAALQGPAEALRRMQDSHRQIAASAPHACGRACPKGPENGLRAGAAPTQVHGAQCGTEEAPQERRRGCTRTPRRRRRSGWTGP